MHDSTPPIGAAPRGRRRSFTLLGRTPTAITNLWPDLQGGVDREDHVGLRRHVRRFRCGLGLTYPGPNLRAVLHWGYEFGTPLTAREWRRRKSDVSPRPAPRSVGPGGPSVPRSSPSWGARGRILPSPGDARLRSSSVTGGGDDTGDRRGSRCARPWRRRRPPARGGLSDSGGRSGMSPAAVVGCPARWSGWCRAVCR